MIQPISGFNSYSVSQIQPTSPRPVQPQEIPRQVQEQTLQDAAIYEPSNQAREMVAAGYGPDAALRTSGAETAQALSASQENTPPATPSPAQRAQALYQQPESVIREFTRSAGQSMPGQQVDIMV